MLEGCRVRDFLDAVWIQKMFWAAPAAPILRIDYSPWRESGSLARYVHMVDEVEKDAGVRNSQEDAQSLSRLRLWEALAALGAACRYSWGQGWD